MTAEDSRHLHDFLHNFGAAALGEGDTVAGANTLAAMAISIANVQRPGSRLQAKDEAGIAVGCNLFVSGSHTVSQVTEKVLDGLAARQNNLGKRLLQLTRRNNSMLGRPSSLLPISQDRDAVVEDSLIGMLLSPDGIPASQTDLHWGAVMGNPPTTGLEGICARPVFYATAGTADRLESQIARSHMGRPFVRVAMEGEDDFARFGPLVTSVTGGSHVSGTDAEIVRGFVVATDPGGMLAESFRAGLASSRWVSRTVWLVDDNAGPEPDERPEPSVSAMGSIEVRYNFALGTALGVRINNQTTAPLVLECEFAGAQERWIGFLKRLEQDFPGIIGTARNLLPSLIFGLRRIADARPVHGGPGDIVAQAGALARFLVHRMVNARAVMLTSAERTRMANLEDAIIRKLGYGPQSARMLSRRFHNMSSATCLAMLEDLQAAGRVAYRDGSWEVAQAALIAHSGAPALEAGPC